MEAESIELKNNVFCTPSQLFYSQNTHPLVSMPLEPWQGGEAILTLSATTALPAISFCTLSGRAACVTVVFAIQLLLRGEDKIEALAH